MIKPDEAYKIIDRIMDGGDWSDDAWDALCMAMDAIEIKNREQSNGKICDYCHKDLDGYVKPLEKNSHAFIWWNAMDGWHLSLKAKGWHGMAPIKYCPMCGRRLKCEN